MKSTGRRAIVLIAFCCFVPLRAEELALLLSFNGRAMEPNTPCNGSVDAGAGQVVGIEPVLFGPDDSVAATSWLCSTWGTPEAPGMQKPNGGKLVKRARVLMMSRSKGVLVKLAVAPDAPVRFDTALGRFSVTPSDLPSSGRPVLDGKVLVQKAPYSSRLSGAESEDEFPGLAATPDGTVWVAWQSWDGTSDTLRCSHTDGAGWSEPEEIPAGKGDYFGVVLAAGPDGTLWAVWSANLDGAWDLWCAQRTSSWGKPLRLTTTPGADFNHKLLPTPDGRLVVVWQSDRQGQYDVLMADLTAAGLGDTTAVTTHAANDWEPSPAVRRDGTVAVVWDTYRNGSYDVYVRTFPRRGEPSPPTPVAVSGNYEAHASAAYDPQGRLWICWDDGGPNWGKHGRPAPVIHRQRRVKLCCLDAERCLVPEPLPDSCLGEELRGLWELPALTMDSAGQPVVVFRQLAPVTRWNTRKGEKEGQSRGIWAHFVTRFDGETWSRPRLLPGSAGRNDQRVALAWSASGQLWAAYAGDGRQVTRAEEPVNNNVFAASVPLGSATAKAQMVEAPWEREPEDLREAVRDPRPVRVGDASYRVVFGDTHRHTDISRCGMNHDGSLLDTYRYAIDAVKLDFLGIADHDQDILKHRYGRPTSTLQGYMWWRSEKLCDLFFMPDSFIPLYGYEHGGSFKARGGHKNVMYATRGNPCIEEDAPADLFKALKGRFAVAIPHQLADGGSATDWDRWDGEWETVAEIFQARGSYEFLGTARMARVKREGCYIWDALAKGVRTGIIASSDHGLTHSAYACVFVEERTRRGIIEALRARRTYGATDTIVLDFRIGSLFMGEEGTVTGAPALAASVVGMTELARVDVVRNNQFVYTVNPEGAAHRFSFTDTDLASGEEAYYYLRCVQDNNEIAWSSPIWIKRE